MFARIIKRSCVTSSRLCIRPSIQCSHASKQFYQSSSVLLKDDDGAKKAARNLTDSLRKLLEDADHPQIEQLKSDNNGRKDDSPTTISSLVAKATKKESKLPQFDNYVNGINAFLESEWSHDTFHMSLVDPPIRSNVDQFGGLHHWSNQLYMGYEPRAVVVLQRDIEYSYRIAVIDWKNQEMSVVEHIFPEGLQELQEDIANAQPGDLDDFPTLDSVILNDAQSRLVQQLDYAELDQPDRYDHTTRSVINRVQLAYRNKILPYTKLKVPISREWLTAFRKVRWPAVELELRRANFPGVGDPIFDTCLSFGQMGAEATRLVNYSQFADKNLTAGH